MVCLYIFFSYGAWVSTLVISELSYAHISSLPMWWSLLRRKNEQFRECDFVSSITHIFKTKRLAEMSNQPYTNGLPHLHCSCVYNNTIWLEMCANILCACVEWFQLCWRDSVNLYGPIQTPFIFVDYTIFDIEIVLICEFFRLHADYVGCTRQRSNQPLPRGPLTVCVYGLALFNVHSLVICAIDALIKFAYQFQTICLVRTIFRFFFLGVY